MKLFDIPNVYVDVPSPPVRGAWIETACCYCCACGSCESPPVRGAWIETISALVSYIKS